MNLISRGSRRRQFRARTKWKQVASSRKRTLRRMQRRRRGSRCIHGLCRYGNYPSPDDRGMLIAAYARANKRLIYVRAEYPLAVKRLKLAIAQAERMGLLGGQHPGNRILLPPASTVVQELSYAEKEVPDRIPSRKTRHAAVHGQYPRGSCKTNSIEQSMKLTP